jgi:hypothetical protein
MARSTAARDWSVWSRMSKLWRPSGTSMNVDVHVALGRGIEKGDDRRDDVRVLLADAGEQQR